MCGRNEIRAWSQRYARGARSCAHKNARRPQKQASNDQWPAICSHCAVAFNMPNPDDRFRPMAIRWIFRFATSGQMIAY
jgi:hypothetical protein